jgi:hypothetical protein
MLLVLTVTFIASAALCVLAWRLVVLDRAAAQQREWERLEHAADSGSGMLLQRLNETGARLRGTLDGDSQRGLAALRALADGCSFCMALLMNPGRLTVYPDRKLRYVPESAAAVNTDEAMFSGGEAIEFGTRDYGRAARWFLDLVRRSSGAARSAALLRAARNFAKADQADQALSAWAELEKLGAVPVNGEPGDRKCCNFTIA